MGAINKVSLKGQLGKEPSWGALPNGALACRLVLATSDEEEDEATGVIRKVTEWHRAVLSGPLADQVRNGVSKGDEVYVEGKLHTRKWVDRKGITRYCTEILAASVLVFPRTRAQVATIADDELITWVSQFDAVMAREAEEATAKASTLRQHRARMKTRTQACH